MFLDSHQDGSGLFSQGAADPEVNETELSVETVNRRLAVDCCQLHVNSSHN